MLSAVGTQAVYRHRFLRGDRIKTVNAPRDHQFDLQSGHMPGFWAVLGISFSRRDLTPLGAENWKNTQVMVGKWDMLY